MNFMIIIVKVIPIVALLDINDLPKCSKFSITSGGYEGLWNTIFIKPLTWVLIKLGEILRNYGLAIIVATMLIRLLLYPITKKTLKQSEMMKKIQPVSIRKFLILKKFWAKISKNFASVSRLNIVRQGLIPKLRRFGIKVLSY